MTRVSDLDATWTASWMRLGCAEKLDESRAMELFSELCKLVKSFSGFELAASSAALRDIILLNFARARLLICCSNKTEIGSAVDWPNI